MFIRKTKKFNQTGKCYLTILDATPEVLTVKEFFDFVGTYFDNMQVVATMYEHIIDFDKKHEKYSFFFVFLKRRKKVSFLIKVGRFLVFFLIFLCFFPIWLLFFRTHKTISGKTVYHPRVVLLETQKGLGALSELGGLYEQRQSNNNFNHIWICVRERQV